MSTVLHRHIAPLPRAQAPMSPFTTFDPASMRCMTWLGNGTGIACSTNEFVAKRVTTGHLDEVLT